MLKFRSITTTPENRRSWKSPDHSIITFENSHKLQNKVVLHVLNESHWKTTMNYLERSLGMILHYLYYIAVETGCPGKLWFSRKMALKIARIPKISLLNDPKIFFSRKSQKCSESLNSQSYLVKIDFPAPWWKFPLYRVVRGQSKKNRMLRIVQFAKLSS